MAYFAASLTFLMAALALLGTGFGAPTATIGAPDTLVVVHLVTVGWLGLLFCGALLQFVPVLAATHLRLAQLALPALLAISSGLAMLISGFLGLGGYIGIDPAVMPMGAALLALGFGCVIVSAAATIVCRKEFGASALLVLAGLAGLAITVAMGAAFSGLLSGGMDIPLLAERLSFVVPFHAVSGLLGWMTLTAMGVSYRLFAMFMLAPERGNLAKPVSRLGACALIAMYATLAAGCINRGLTGVGLALTILLAVVVAGLYCRDIWRMFWARRRKVLELNSLAGLAALAFLVAGLVLVAAALLVDVETPLGVAGFYLLALGWLSGLGLSQLYKIVPFLTWLETYGTVMGRAQVPRVQDLVDERFAKAWFGLFYVAVAVAGGAILLGGDAVFRIATWCQLAAVAALSLEYLRARRLAYAPDQLRLPPGAVRPHLVYAITDPKE
jgi:hypothetical protein